MSEGTVVKLRARRKSTPDAVNLTPREAATRLAISVRTLQRWVAADAIPHVRLGPNEDILRFPAELLDAYIREHLRGGAR